MSGEEVSRAPSRARRWRRTALHLTGFALGLALLGWIIERAVSDPATRAQLNALTDAPRGEVIVLLALTAASMVLNGLMFWVVPRPVRPLPHGDVQAINAIAYLLANLPLRLGFFFRIAAHNRRNGIPLLTIGGWFGAVAALMAVGLAPPLLASLWRGEADALWWAVSIGGMVAGGAIVVILARFFSTGPGWQRIEAFAEHRRAGLLGRLLKSDALARLHEGVYMLAEPGAVSAAIAIRAFDMLVQGLRFMVAASLIGITLPLDQAVLLTIVYFTVDSVAPTGSLGLKEAATAFAAKAIGHDDLVATVLAVTAAELIVRFVGAAVGAIWLRPDRLLARDAAPPEVKSDEDSQGAGASSASGDAGSTSRT